MGAAVLFTADLTDAGDAYKRGVIGASGFGSAEQTAVQMVEQPQAVDPPIFPRDPVGAGFKLITERLMRLGGTFSVPRGPSPYEPRLRGARGVSAPGPQTVARGIDPRTPAGLVPVDPTYEGYLTGSDGYFS